MFRDTNLDCKTAGLNVLDEHASTRNSICDVHGALASPGFGFVPFQGFVCRAFYFRNHDTIIVNNIPTSKHPRSALSASPASDERIAKLFS